jgi:hypothetical protein
VRSFTTTGLSSATIPPLRANPGVFYCNPEIVQAFGEGDTDTETGTDVACTDNCPIIPSINDIGTGVDIVTSISPQEYVPSPLIPVSL